MSIWVRLFRLFSFQEETMRLAKIVGLGPKNGCPRNIYADIFEGRVDDLIDRNDLCSLPTIDAVTIAHAVTPLLEGS
jgi:hypothetical protein